METYKVSIHSGVREMETRLLQKREPAGDEVLLKVTSCAICTLEQRIWKGVIARYPYAGGHEAAGIVEAVGPDVKGVKPGDKAAVRLLNSCGECYYCRSGHENLCVASFVAHTHSGVMGAGGFAEYMTVSAKAVYKLADDVDLDHAALAEPLAVGSYATMESGMTLGKSAFVIGGGPIGICCGLRLGDVATLRWSDIEGYTPDLIKWDFHGREIIRLTRKTKTVVHIPIERELADYLHDQYEVSGTEEYILPEAAKLYLEHQNVLNNRILGYLHSLGIQTQRSIPGRTRKQSVKDFHSLRHCFCYYAGLRGVPLPVVQSIVGHLTASMTKHYQSHADRKARMQGLALMRGLTGGNRAGGGTPDSLLRQNLTEYIQTASSMEILRLNVLIAQMNDSAKQLNAEVKLLTGT